MHALTAEINIHWVEGRVKKSSIVSKIPFLRTKI